MDILMEILEADPSFKSKSIIINLDHQGLPAARMAGIAATTGDWIIHVDSDDWVEPDYIKLLVGAAKEEGALAMVGTFAIMALIGIVIGLFSGMLGIGGGMVMVPLFRLVFGMSAVGSTATSLFTIIPTSVSGAISHARAKTCVPKLGIALGVGGACTSWLGVWLAQLSPG